LTILGIPSIFSGKKFFNEEVFMSGLTSVNTIPTTSQSLINNGVFKRISELQDAMTKTLEKVEALEKRMSSLEHGMSVLTTKFDLHAHKSDPTAYVNLHGFDKSNWTTEAQYHKSDMPKINEVEQLASKTFATSSSFSSSYSSQTGFSEPRVSVLTRTETMQF
jgi:hypothetical protein